MKNVLLLVVSAVLTIAAPSTSWASLISGTITGWPESGPNEIIGDGTNNVTLFWSINTINRGFFYGSVFTGDSDVAVAPDVVAAVTDITDAAALSYTSGATPAVCDAECASNGVGAFIVMANILSGYFGVLRVDDIVGSGLDATLDATWWFQTDGTGDFSRASIPGPATLALLGLGLFGLRLRRKA